MLGEIELVIEIIHITYNTEIIMYYIIQYRNYNI